MLTCVTNFVISVTKFVTKNICADSKKYLAVRKNFQGERKKIAPSKFEAGGICATWGAGRGLNCLREYAKSRK